MASLVPFLPPHLVRALAKSGPPARLPHVERFPAALLFSDISGFTALTERLQARGREGAEEIADIINAAFGPAIRAIEVQDGSVVSFGGDALFAVFPGTGAVQRAVAAAEEVRTAVARFGKAKTSVGTVELAVRQAVHHGNAIGLHLGDGERRHYLVSGAAVVRLARIESEASVGEIRLSRQAATRLPREREPRAMTQAPARGFGEAASYADSKLPGALKAFPGEYRRAAVLFLETRGFAATKLQAWFLFLVDALGKYDGMLLKSDLSPAGAKWLCTFGIPTAHERDPDRAARVALDLIAAMPPKGLAVRGGLSAGTVVNVVIGTGSRRSFDVMGDVVNTAARALAKAGWGEILATEDVRKALSGVDAEDRGRHAVKGKREPLHLHALKSAGAAVKQIRVSAPMIGRDQELATIMAALERAKSGRGSVIGIKGEAGLGKSRLKYEASLRAKNMGFEVHEGRAISFGGMAYWTVGALVRDALGVPEVAQKESTLYNVSAAAERLGLRPVDRHHLAEVLGARYPDSQIEHLKPQDAWLNNMIAARTFFHALACEQARLLVLEDMHWADGASVEAVGWIAKAAADTSLVVLLLYRPGYEPPKGSSEVTLQDLGHEAFSELLRAHLGVVPRSVEELLKERAGGNPFYVEELVRHLLEWGLMRQTEYGHELVRAPEPYEVPPTIEAVVAARLSKLTVRSRRLAQVAAVLGRSIPLEILARIDRIRGSRTETLRDLVAREILTEDRSGTQPTYAFRHALIRDVAYTSMLHRHRRALHAAAARAIQRVFGRTDDRTASLAFHWEQAGRPLLARRLYFSAARYAASRYAHEEADGLFRSGLKLTPRPSLEGGKALLDLAKHVLRYQGRVRDAIVATSTALSWARRLHEGRLEASALRQQGLLHQDVGEVHDAELHLEQALLRARAMGDLVEEAEVLTALAGRSADAGRLDEARERHERALSLARQGGDKQGEATAIGNMANFLFETGSVGLARELYEKALAVYRELGTRLAEASTLVNLGNVHHQEGALDRATDLYEQALHIVQVLGHRRLQGICLAGLANATFGQRRFEEAEALYHQAIEVHREVDNRPYQALAMGNLGNLLIDQGRIQEAQVLLDEALVLCKGQPRLLGIIGAHLAEVDAAAGRLVEWERRSQQAIDVLRAAGDPQQEAIALLNRARHLRRIGGDPVCAASVLARAQKLATAVHDYPQIVECITERGHAALADGRDATHDLAEAEVWAGRCHRALVAGALDALKRAKSAFATRRAALVRGECTEDLPRWLREHPQAITESE